MTNNQEKNKQTDTTVETPSTPEPPKGPEPYRRRDFTLDKDLKALINRFTGKKQTY